MNAPGGRLAPLGAGFVCVAVAAGAAALPLHRAAAVEIDPAPPTVVGSTIDRPTFPVVIEAAVLLDLAGMPLEELHAWRWDAGSESWSPAPWQIDERSAGGAYLVREEGALDGDDQIVALARYLGGRAPACAWPEAAEGAAVRYDVRVTDPLDAEAEGWLTLLRATPQQQVPTLVRWDRQERELRGTDYRLVQAGRFVGLETIELFDSGVDILDRTKLRGDVYVKVAPMIGPVPLPTIVFDESYTEESEEIQEVADDFVFRPVKQGPVRLVLEADGSGFAYPGQVQVLAAFGRVEIPTIPTQVAPFIDRLELSFRMSVDLSADALVGRYSDGNVPDGVTVDGRHESIPQRPISDWRQVDTPYGGLVVVSGRPQVLRALGNYYNDRGRDEAPGTGDNKAYGEFGVFTEDYDAVRHVADFLGWLVAVPPGSPIVGETVARQLAQPLRVEVLKIERVPCAPTPTTVWTAPSTVPATATVEPTPSATPVPTDEPRTATPSSTPTEPPEAFLPTVHRHACFPGKVAVDVVLVMDTSTSMLESTGPGDTTRLEAARRAATAFALLFDPRFARLAVVSFDEQAIDRTDGLTADQAVVLAALDGLTTAPGTRIDAGLALARMLLARPDHRDRARVAVLLSDGGSPAEPARAEAGRLRSDGVRLFAIGLGADADVELLRALVSTPSDYRGAGDEADLAAIYRSIGAEITCRP